MKIYSRRLCVFHLTGCALFSEGLDLFREFLRTEFSEENIEFWIACEDYKNVHSNKLNTEAQRIYTDFIAVQAPHEVGGQGLILVVSHTRVNCRCQWC